MPTSRMDETAKSISMLLIFLLFGSFLSASLCACAGGCGCCDMEAGAVAPIVIGDGLEERWFKPAYRDGYMEAAIECREPGARGGGGGAPCGENLAGLKLDAAPNGPVGG